MRSVSVATIPSVLLFFARIGAGADSIEPFGGASPFGECDLGRNVDGVPNGRVNRSLAQLYVRINVIDSSSCGWRKMSLHWCHACTNLDLVDG